MYYDLRVLVRQKTLICWLYLLKKISWQLGSIRPVQGSRSWYTAVEEITLRLADTFILVTVRI